MKLSFILFIILTSFDSFSGPELSLHPTPSEIEHILAQKEGVENEYKGQNGLIKYTNRYFTGDMKKAYKFTTQAMGIKIIKIMEWSSFLGANSFLIRQEIFQFSAEKTPHLRNQISQLTLMETHLNSIGISENSIKERHLLRTLLKNKKRDTGKNGIILTDEEKLIARKNDEKVLDHQEKIARQVLREWLFQEQLSNAHISELVGGTEHERQMAEQAIADAKLAIQHRRLDRQLRRSILRGTTNKIDFAKWEGVQKGLENAVNEFMHRSERIKPYNTYELTRERFLFTEDTISASESLLLGWENPAQTEAEMRRFKEEIKQLTDEQNKLKKITEEQRKELKVQQERSITLKKEKRTKQEEKITLEENRRKLLAEHTRLKEKIRRIEEKIPFSPTRRKRKAAERKLMREILEISEGEIDYVKWYGQKTGLIDAANEYMHRSGYSRPYNKLDLLTVRARLRHQVISVSESKTLGWKKFSKSSSDGFKHLVNNPISSRKVMNKSKILGINFKTSTKKGMRK